MYQVLCLELKEQNRTECCLVYMELYKLRRQSQYTVINKRILTIVNKTSFKKPRSTGKKRKEKPISTFRGMKSTAKRRHIQAEI